MTTLNTMYQDSNRFYELHSVYPDTLTISRSILENLATQDETKQMYAVRNQMNIRQNIHLSEFETITLMKYVLKVTQVNIINDNGADAVASASGYTFSRKPNIL